MKATSHTKKNGVCLSINSNYSIYEELIGLEISSLGCRSTPVNTWHNV